MNNQIEKLMAQAWEQVDAEVSNEDWHTYVHENLFQVKFTHLLVKECIDAAGSPADELIKGDTWHDGVRASCQSIKQHFGVEE